MAEDEEEDFFNENDDDKIADGSVVAVRRDLGSLQNVPVRVCAILGRAQVLVSDLVKMKPGTVLGLDRKVGEAVEIFVNDKLVARGEVVIVENKLGISITEIEKD